MKALTLLCAIVFVAGASAQSPHDTSPPVSERLCGKLIDGMKNGHNLSRVTMSLFAADTSRDCCNGATAVATTTTGRWGGFQFKIKHLPDGLYWLQAEPNGRKYRMLVRFAPKKYSDELCTQTYWQTGDDSHLEMGHYITVD